MTLSPAAFAMGERSAAGAPAAPPMAFRAEARAFAAASLLPPRRPAVCDSPGVVGAKALRFLPPFPVGEAAPLPLPLPSPAPVASSSCSRSCATSTASALARASVEAKVWRIARHV